MDTDRRLPARGPRVLREGGPGMEPAFEALEPRVLLGAGDITVTALPISTKTQIQKLTASDGEGYDYLGTSVAMGDGVAIVGAQGDDDKAGNAGAAYVFQRAGGSWTQQQKLTASDGQAEDRFGVSVAVSGDVAIIGARWDDDMGGQSGSAYVFQRTGGTWTQQQKLRASDGSAADFFGASVAISGDFAIIGAWGDQDAGGQSGSAYIFRRDEGVWTQQQKLTASDASAGDQFGFSVSISGRYAVVGAPLVGQGDQGQAYVFRRDGTTWVQETRVGAFDQTGGDEFGHSVSISGDYLVAGAHRDDDNGTDSGSAYVFHREAGRWPEQQKLTKGSPGQDERFGSSVAISGDRIVVGSPASSEQIFAGGTAYLYFRVAGGWSPWSFLAASDVATQDDFGGSVCIRDQDALVGAPYCDAPAFDSGAAYLFDLTESIVPQPIPYRQEFCGDTPVRTQGWEYHFSNAGRIRVEQDRLAMDNTTYYYQYARNEAILHVNLAGKQGVVLSVDHYNNNDENHVMPAVFAGQANGDGIAFSADGTTWYKLTDLVGSFVGRFFDLDAAVAGAGISYSSDFRIKFQQYDNSPWDADGRAFDNVLVTSIWPFFSETYYLARYPDVQAAVNAHAIPSGKNHFIRFGIREGRDFSPFFDGGFYTRHNPDVAAEIAEGIYRSAFEHYLHYGAAEGRSPSPFFHEAYYVAAHADVHAAVTAGVVRCGLEHYLRFGATEGRSATFNERRYLALYADVANAVAAGAFQSGLQHYLRWGWIEGRNPCPFYMESYYLALYGDVKALVIAGTFKSGLEHLIRFGQVAGRSAAFDEARYRAMYPDVNTAIINATVGSGLEHFLKNGQAEGRNPCPYFIDSEYLGMYSDVAAAVSAGAYRSGLEHYLLRGQFEGRLPRS